MKRFRLVGTINQTETSFLLYAHSCLDAGARWKSDPTFYGIDELQHIEEISSGERRYWKKRNANGRITHKQAAKLREPHAEKPAKASLRQPKVRVEFSF